MDEINIDQHRKDPAASRGFMGSEAMATHMHFCPVNTLNTWGLAVHHKVTQAFPCGFSVLIRGFQSSHWTSWRSPMGWTGSQCQLDRPLRDIADDEWLKELGRYPAAELPGSRNLIVSIGVVDVRSYCESGGS